MIPMKFIKEIIKMINRKTAAWLAIIIGGFGIHKFYMKKYVSGSIYLLFSWTCIPGIVGLIEGIIYLRESDEKFQERLIK
jgi:TM2 domain-containing membrane protein YozV